MIRAAYVCADPGVPAFGRKGCSIHVQEVLRALARRGVELELFAARLGGAAPAGLEGVAVHRLPSLSSCSAAERERACLAANATLQTALESRGPFDLVYERYALWSFAAMEAARTWGVPGMLEVNAPLVEEQSRHRALVDRDGALRCERRVFEAAACLLPVSEELARYVRGVAGDARIDVIPNGVDPVRFLGPALRRGAPGRFTVGFVGSLRPWHGLGELVAGFGGLVQHEPAARLLVVGDGPERASLESDLERRGLRDLARLEGVVPHTHVPRLLSKMDVAVAPYPDTPSFYFSPLKLLEYMASGLAVVASRIGQIGDLLQQERTGLLVPPGDPEELTRALLRLYRDLPLRMLLGAQARSCVVEHHTWDGVAGRVLALADLEPALRAAAAGAR